MIFKQNALKEEKIRFLIAVTGVFALYLATIVLCLTQKEENPEDAVFVLSILFFPILILMILIGLNCIEWFCVYNNRIEAMCIYGRKNVVYFKDVLFVQELTINLTKRGMPKKFLVFNDGRKNSTIFFGLANSCYNIKRSNLQIPKTPQLEKYVIEVLKFEIKKENS